MNLDSISSRLPLVAGFLGVTAMPTLVSTANEVIPVVASVPVASNTTVLFQSIIAAITLLSEVFKWWQKRKTNKFLINSQNKKDAIQ